jgi:hypothetical protein
MWVLLPAVSLAIVHIAGDNLAVVPDMAAVFGKGIYATTFFAYMICGAVVTGISAWIGVQTGQELMVVVRRIFGCTGKKLLAFSTIVICIPASAITGGYFSGWILHMLIDIPHPAASLLCLTLFAIMASGWGDDILRASNYASLLLMPIILVMVLLTGSSLQMETNFLYMGDINWPLVLALIGYNAGGMRPALVVEAAAYLARKKNKAVILAIMAKLVEGLFTLLIAHAVLVTGAKGPLALAQAAGSIFGKQGWIVFNILLLCTFMNTMVPAMIVNARQIGILTGFSYGRSLVVTLAVVYLCSYLDFNQMLMWMSVTGLLMAMFLLFTAGSIHKVVGKKL